MVIGSPRRITALDIFSSAILDVEKLLETPPPGECESLYYRMLYANLITTMETYLGDTFIGIVANDESLKARANEVFLTIRNNRSFFKPGQCNREKMAEVLDRLTWHRLDEAKTLYKEVLGIDFPQDKGNRLKKAVEIRHDIIHRNGKTKKGIGYPFTHKDVVGLKNLAERFIVRLERKMGQKGFGSILDLWLPFV